jgi:hypothetical protein
MRRQRGLPGALPRWQDVGACWQLNRCTCCQLTLLLAPRGSHSSASAADSIGKTSLASGTSLVRDTGAWVIVETTLWTVPGYEKPANLTSCKPQSTNMHILYVVSICLACNCKRRTLVIQCGQALLTDLRPVLTACAVLTKMAAWCDSDGLMPYDSDMNFDDDDDDQSTYTGMLRKDISARLKGTFGSDFCSNRADELDIICHMVYGHGDLQPQEACLQMLCDSKEILNCEKFLPRQIVRLAWPQW